MSDDKKKLNGNDRINDSKRSSKINGKSDGGNVGKSDNWDKIDKKGQGSGDRPKRD